jgi:hypothetical protein
MNFSKQLGRLTPILAHLFILFLIVRNGVDVPFWDEWSLPGMFFAADKHEFKDFLAQHNEAREVFPRLIFLGASKLLGWHPKQFMYFGWLMGWAMFLLIRRQCYRPLTRGNKQDWTTLACLALSAALLFSPAGYENWLWGLQWTSFVPLFCALLACNLQLRIRSMGLRLGATIVLNTVATFSFSNGMLTWVVTFPFWKEALALIAGRRSPKPSAPRFLLWSSAYGLAAVIAIGAYFTDFHQVAGHPPLTLILKEPWTVVKYFAAWCSGSFRLNATMHIVLGLALFMAVLVLLGFMASTAKKQQGWRRLYYLRKLYPSLMLIIYAFGSGTMTSLGRAGFGIEQAWSPRYLIHSAVLSIGFIAALNTHRIIMARRRQPAIGFNRLCQGTIALLSFLMLRSWNHGYKDFEMVRISRTQQLMNIRMLPLAPDNPMLAKICPWLDLPALLGTLKAKGIYDPSSYGEWLRDAVKHPQQAKGGAVQVLPRPQSEIGVMGWATIPERNVPADSVLLCRRGKTGELEPYFMLAVGFKRDEPVRETGKSSLRKSGFLEVFRWPEGDDFSSVEMFSVDESNRRLYPIPRIP